MSQTIVLPSPNDRLHIKRANLTPEAVELMVENAYLGLPADFDEERQYNILLDTNRRSLFESPVVDFLDVMSNPDYFYYTCKWLFNINLLPFQCVILKELWTRKFPMVIATRGG